ncbi:pentatricopeptide repeat-containing protein At1g80880, mitochondrial [Andrographis paniculata]|uniref:pentatricopeptide repeat-containing protein At1g80880, mitochondrial n=1 Tax=Andrographis paniculata TaxID=175694 RepID=UPI0021E71946|nr:pentatricopeptide repeat-containing protein At1g80880, mitochondrial [Andrographis paniculata]
MALLAIVRNLRFRKGTPNFSQIPYLLPRQFTSQLNPSFVRAFHRTPCRRPDYAPQLSFFPQDQSQSQVRSISRKINFSDWAEEVRGDAQLGLGEVLERVRKAKDFASGDEAVAFLDGCGVKPDKDFIFSCVWGLREEWKLAYLVFKWGEKWECLAERTWWLVIWVLGSHKKFSTAWTLIRELHRDASIDAQQAMLIMIDRYAAANYPDKAIETFHLMQKFKFSPEQESYFTFLDILCRHGNIEEAEEFMFVNKKFFPLEIETFNIILNGWCNILKDIYEAKRVWREMSSCCIEPDGTSYTHMISCYANVDNLFDSLRLYDQMKRRGWTPGAEVYHSLIYVLTRANCLDESFKIVDRMKATGLELSSTTYNLMIRPLCEANKFEEARGVLARMFNEGINPSVDTYHAMILGENLYGTLGVFDHMKKVGLGPDRTTFILVLERFFRLGEPQNALEIWSKMDDYGVKPDETHYVIFVKGLAKCGLMSEAKKFYSEMTSIGLDDPSIKKLLVGMKTGSGARKNTGEMTIVRCVKKGKGLRRGKNKASR